MTGTKEDGCGECNRKNEFHGAGKEKTRTINDHRKNWLFSDESPMVIGNNNCVCIRQKSDEVNNFVSAPSNSKLSDMLCGCICLNGVEKFTSVKSNINFKKNIEVLEKTYRPLLSDF